MAVTVISATEAPLVKLNFLTQGALLNATSYSEVLILVMFKPHVPDTKVELLLPMLPALFIILSFSLAITVATPGVEDEKVTAGVLVLAKEYVSAAGANATGEPAGGVAGGVPAESPPPPPPHAATAAVIATNENKVLNFILTSFKVKPNYQ